eukprot:TRINITY_DN2239_c0_g3_i1.p1 TRINITY_DN2239_c0_g3~~TRINITY_DN2239_c0_g3_i1.p1  ORF type:complete len:141 (-),score=33.69 TRINITY_DN2239_c0_g3_i1:133-555(-)
MGKKSKSTNDFWNTVKDTRQLLRNSMSEKEKHSIDNSRGRVKEKGQKMPIKFLNGIRKKRIQKFKEQTEQNRLGQVFYDSSSQKVDVGFQTRKNVKERLKRRKGGDNSYRYKGVGKRKFGKEQDGLLVIRKKDLKKLGKQ